MPRTPIKKERKKTERKPVRKTSGKAVLPIAVLAASAGVVLLAIYFNRRNRENTPENYDFDVENYEVTNHPMISSHN